MVCLLCFPRDCFESLYSILIYIVYATLTSPLLTLHIDLLHVIHKATISLFNGNDTVDFCAFSLQTAPSCSVAPDEKLEQLEAVSCSQDFSASWDQTEKLIRAPFFSAVSYLV